MGQFILDSPKPVWLTNTDLSINGHMTDTDHWIASELHDQRRRILCDKDARDLVRYLHTQPKCLTFPCGVKDTVVPAEQLSVLCFTRLNA